MSQRCKESETQIQIKIQFCDKSVVISRSREPSIAMSLDEVVEVGFNSDNASAAKSDLVTVDVVVLCYYYNLIPLFPLLPLFLMGVDFD